MDKKVIKTALLLLFSLLLFTIRAEAETNGNDQNTEIQGKIISGDLSMTPPNDLSFKVQLSGQMIIKEIGQIETTVTDFRGIAQGWEIDVSSPNYRDYHENFSLLLNGSTITDKNQKIVVQPKRMQVQRETIQATVIVSSRAAAGKYRTKLEWNLQPGTTIKE
ncbi:MAG: hypothetical protein LKJ03_04790 [Enterococcaceae bacterium]|nr:hypothetical protein [Enterococcaceae bacterium]MCI1919502.1 hypothetical protein [Enterococcaceae bacterium]